MEFTSSLSRSPFISPEGPKHLHCFYTYFWYLNIFATSSLTRLWEFVGSMKLRSCCDLDRISLWFACIACLPGQYIEAEWYWRIWIHLVLAGPRRGWICVFRLLRRPVHLRFIFIYQVRGDYTSLFSRELRSKLIYTAGLLTLSGTSVLLGGCWHGHLG